MMINNKSLILLVCVGSALLLTLRTITISIRLMHLPAVAEFSDPRTRAIVINEEGGSEEQQPGGSLFVVSETRLLESKYVPPAIVHSRSPSFDHKGWVVDILSIGSRSRPEYMTAQLDTWASHIHVRNFWGVNEGQDYDPQCDRMDNATLQSYIQSCRGDMGWKKVKLEKFRQANFGNASGIAIESRNAGWYCAQRRLGHGLGWLMDMYRNRTNIPDILMIVDDDTSVDIAKLKLTIQQQHPDFTEDLPFVAAGCTFKYGFAFGGFGTFFNKAAIYQLTQPMYCYTADGNSSRHQPNHVAHSDLMALSCNSLRQNFIGELDVFQNGDSVLDLFYKYSAKQQFCLHSDWALGYMVSLYLHTDISKLVEPQRCSNHHKCELSFSITCHNHGPEDMQNFARQRAERESSIPARVPNVLLVGAQKAGTSAVADWLFSAHAICSARTFAGEPDWYAKEVHFFEKNERFEQGAEFYTRRFDHCNSSDFIMDATPNYATHAIRIGNFYRELVPSNNYSVATTPLDGYVQGLKVMMILREPVSRELSWYNHKAFNMKFTSGLWGGVLKSNHTFDEYTDDELLRKPIRFSKAGQCYGALCLSLYSTLIPQWLQVIPRSQMLILSYQELKNDPDTFMKRIEGFLGLPPHKPNATLEQANVNSFAEKTPLPSCRSKNKLAEIFQPFNEELYALLRQSPGPPMEQSPFPEFDVQGCIPDDGAEDMQKTALEQEREGKLRVPNVLLVGAQKAGTSAVAKWLFSAYAICSARTFAGEPDRYAKEVHFFDKNERFEQGAEFYTRRFDHCNSSDFIMDATPRYAAHAIRIGNFYRELVPSNNYSVATTPLDGYVQGLKVMMILREPVSRELSWYNHKAFIMECTSGLWGESNHTFDEYTDEVLLHKPIRLSKAGQCYGELCLSLYSTLIPQWLQVIPRSQMLILSYQELKNDPGTFMKRIEDFLGLPPHKPNATLEQKNVNSFAGKVSLPSCRSKNKLTGIFQPFNEELYALLRQNPGPSMEQSPFPEFDVQGCMPDEGMS